MQNSGLVCHLVPIDWIIIIGFIALSILISLFYSRRAFKSTKEYFKSGEGLTWWLLGTSMVATTFAADTPLAIAGMVVTGGISLNWYWWCGIPITLAGVFFFASLWKRANPLTDPEFIQQRYSGKSARFLRGFKALWMALTHGAIVLGWVNLAMATVIRLVWPVIPRVALLDGLMLTLFLHSPLSTSVNKNIISSVKKGEISPIEIAYEYDILKDPVLWSDIKADVYKDNEQHAISLLGLSDRLTTASLSAFPASDVPPFLYQKEPGERKKDPASQSAQGRMNWPVTLGDQRVVDREEISGWKAAKPMTLDIGKSLLEQESIRSKTRTAPLKDFTTLGFLTEIYTISSGINQYKVLFILFLITCSYVAISGLWGVIITDFIQFWIAMAGCILLAFLAVKVTGGMKGTLTRMVGIYGLDKARAMTSLFPTASGGKLGMMSIYDFAIYVSIIWWAVGFTDGGGSFAQRMLSAKNERHAALGYLWFAVAHFALRMWPWIIVGFVAAVLFPFVPYKNGALPPTGIAEQGYVKTMIFVLPAGLMGVMVAAFLAAYMSTISTIVNLGASYLLHDFYRPFIAPRIEARKGRQKQGFQFTEKHYVKMGVFFTVVMSILGIAVSLSMNSIVHAWFLLSAMYGGIGLIFLLRWYWHRINAWTEVVCMASLVFFTVVMWFLSVKFKEPGLMPSKMWPYNVLILAPVSVCLAMLVTLLTKPVEREHLKAFYKKVQPGGPGWRDIEEEIKKEDPSFKPRTPLTWANFKYWFLSNISVFCYMFGIGKIIMGDTLYPDAIISNRIIGVLLLVLGTVCGYIVVRSFRPKKWEG